MGTMYYKISLSHSKADADGFELGSFQEEPRSVVQGRQFWERG